MFQGYNNNYKNNSFKNNNKEQSKYPMTEALTEKIKHASGLCSILTVEEVNLPSKSAYNVALEVKKTLNTNQLRKIFEQIKNCEKFLPDVVETRKELYKVLPLMAYAVGRDNCPKEFFNLLKECICEQRLKQEEDIKRLVEFLTSIVAYTKFLG